MQKLRQESQKAQEFFSDSEYLTTAYNRWGENKILFEKSTGGTTLHWLEARPNWQSPSCAWCGAAPGISAGDSWVVSRSWWARRLGRQPACDRHPSPYPGHQRLSRGLRSGFNLSVRIYCRRCPAEISLGSASVKNKQTKTEALAKARRPRLQVCSSLRLLGWSFPKS